jgi:hypothetical protein
MPRRGSPDLLLLLLLRPVQIKELLQTPGLQPLLVGGREELRLLIRGHRVLSLLLPPDRTGLIPLLAEGPLCVPPLLLLLLLPVFFLRQAARLPLRVARDLRVGVSHIDESRLHKPPES